MQRRGTSLTARWVLPARDSFRRLVRSAWSHPIARATLLALLAVDVACILYFWVAGTLYELDRDPSLYYHKELLLTTDGGIPEWFNYAQLTFAVAAFVRLARWTRQPIYPALAVTYVIVLLDDATKIHEVAGVYFADLLDLPRKILEMRGRDVGEVITWAIFGMIVVPLVLYGLSRSNARHRGNGLAFLLPFGALLVAAILIDQADRFVRDFFETAVVYSDMAEDGGEMLSISLTCALAFGALRESAPRGPTPTGSA